MQFLPEALRPLGDYSQFILWEAVWSAAKNKYEKYPTCPITRARIDHTNPANWLTFQAASALAVATGLGIGFYLSERDPFFVVDMDNVLQADGTWTPGALDLCRAFGGGAVEISYSGTGLHIFGVGQWPQGHRCKTKEHPWLEFYTSGRFMAITGTGAVGHAYTDCTQGIGYLLASYLIEREIHGSDQWTTAPVPEWDGPTDDDELVKKMLAAKPSQAAVFGGRATVKQLWEADVEAMSKHFPSATGDVFDRSSADAALMQHLAFWCGKDCERMQRLFERSGLMRDKWRDREEYRIDTITKGNSWCKDVYKMRRKIDKPEPAAYGSGQAVPEGVIRDGFQYLGLPQQLEHFRGCVYVSSQHAIKIPNGLLLTAERFKTEYGGYMFALDSIGDKSSKNAWEVFTESQGLRFPRADLPCFRPELPVNEIINEGGLRLVNVYVPIDVPCVEGDPSIFLNHLARMIPDVNDRAILLAYMATCVQHIGTKLRWCPFIQGVEGNGKSTISDIVAEAIGHRYCFSPKASSISSDFNSWAENRVFIYVEDVYTRERQETIEALKPMITQTTVAVQPKGIDQYMVDNRFNFILNSNHKDGYTKTNNDRRTAPFYCRQQSIADLVRDGMDGAYFQVIKDWLKFQGGYAIMTHYLKTYPVPVALDPRYMSCAPYTTSTAEALDVGLGSIEQEVLEMINRSEQGFAGGWVSSIALERLLDSKNLGRKIPQNKRKDLMEALGYVRHPGLPEGRSNSVIMMDAGRPRLYIKQGHLAMQLQGNKAIVDAYTKAQDAATVTEVAQHIFNKG